MMVKVGNRYYDSEKTPVMIILSDDEKSLIKNMGDNSKLCSYPEDMSAKDIEKFMDIRRDIDGRNDQE